MRGFCTPESTWHDLGTPLPSTHSFPTGEPGDKRELYNLTQTAVVQLSERGQLLTGKARGPERWGRGRLRCDGGCSFSTASMSWDCSAADLMPSWGSFTAQHGNLSLSKDLSPGRARMAAALRALSFPLPPGRVPPLESPAQRPQRAASPLMTVCSAPCHHLSAGSTGTGGREPVEAPDAGEPAEARGAPWSPT